MKTTATLVMLLWASTSAVCQSAATPPPNLTPPAQPGVQTPHMLPIASPNPPSRQIPKTWPDFKLKPIPAKWPKFQLTPVNKDAVRVLTGAPR
jgi:hypothetical protein